MENAFWTALGASSLASVVTAAGIFTIRHFADWGRKYSIYFVCFAAGVLIAVSFLHIIPKSLEMTPHAPAFLLLGFMALHLFNRFASIFVCEQGDESSECGPWLIPMLGIGLHSFIDGFVYSITFSVGIFTGALAATGMVLHEFPEGIITYMLLVRGGCREKAALVLALVAASISTPLGMLVSYPFVSRTDQPLLGTLLALSAGALAYVGATHLLPQAEKEQPRHGLLALGAGILVAVLIVLSK